MNFSKRITTAALLVASLLFMGTVQPCPNVSPHRVCMMTVGSDNASAVLVDADLGPQGQICVIPYDATIIEVDVYADGGTPSVVPRKKHGASYTDITSAALATASSGGVACANPTGTGTCIDGSTSASGSVTVTTTALAKGDTIGLSNTTHSAGGVAKRATVAVLYDINP